MGDYRSESYTDGKMQIVSYYDRSYSAPYASSYSGEARGPPPLSLPPPPPYQLKKGKSMGGGSWGLIKDPEFQRKKRVASYKVYSVEGKVKGSFRKSFRWLKDKYTQVVYGWS